MDDFYQVFKPWTYVSTNHDAYPNVSRRGVACHKQSMITNDHGEETQAMSPIPPLPATSPLVILDKDGKHSDRSYDEQSSKKQKIVHHHP